MAFLTQADHQIQTKGASSLLRDKISGQRTDLFLTVSVLGQKMSVPKRHSVGKIVEMVSQGTAVISGQQIISHF